MAGIGQRSNFDYPPSWSSAAQLGMGRTMQNDSQKNLASFQSNADKRSLLTGSSGASAFSGINSGLGFNYPPRNSSSTRNKGLTSTGGSIRPSNYTPDSGLENVPFSFLNYGSSSPFSNNPIPQRGLSDPSLFSGLGNASINQSDFSNLKAFPGKNITNTGFFGGNASSPSSTPNNLINPSGTPGMTSPGLTFDPSEFPPINSVGRSQAGQSAYGSANRNYVSAISKSNNAGSNHILSSSHGQNSFSASGTPGEFCIDQDFPALPAAIGTPTSNPTSLPLSTTPTTPITTNASVSKNANQRLQRSQSTGGGTVSTAGGINTSSYAGASNTGGGGTLEFLKEHCVANMPKNMIHDQFGMIGLLKLIQIGRYDTTFEMLAPGLASVGIHDWLQPGELHSSLASPCQESCMLRPQDTDYNVPAEYLIRHQISYRLPDPPLEQLSEETLFWLFYNCCREEVQLVAAKELYHREWRFHKKKQLWLTRAGNHRDFIQDGSYEQGIYSYWDPNSAEKLTQQMKICYADLDETPTTFRLSTPTLNASVQIITGANQHLYTQHQYASQNQGQVFTASNRISRPTAVSAGPQNPNSAAAMTVATLSAFIAGGGGGGGGGSGGKMLAPTSLPNGPSKLLPSGVDPSVFSLVKGSGGGGGRSGTNNTAGGGASSSSSAAAAAADQQQVVTSSVAS